VEKYNVGNKVNVYYNPNNYNDSVLERGLNILSIISILIVLSFIAICLIILFSNLL